jgi:protein farnesyltransferase subunit beta
MSAAAPHQPEQRPVLFWYPPPPTQLDDDDLPTHSSREQREVERRVTDSQAYVLPPKKKSKRDFFGGGGDDDGAAQREEPVQLTECPALCEVSFASHAAYLLGGLMGHQGCHYSLESSQPWLVYWCLHGLDVLDRLDMISDELAVSIVHFLRKCAHPEGGFGGGPGQQAHTAPTYAAVLSLAILSSHSGCSSEAITLLRDVRKGVLEFHLRCKVSFDLPNGAGVGAGGFRVSKDGEVDTRGAYTSLSVASLLNTLTPQLASGVGTWLARCQTYEGGLGGEPGTEAHGGYAFCGLAAAVLVREQHRLNLPLLLKWASNRQMEREGGFQGRTNKLVDGCYSFWVGALFPLLHALLQQGEVDANKSSDSSTSASSASSPPPSANSAADAGWLFDTLALQRYVLVSCQMAIGGLRDKPGKSADLYHSCYCLAGLSVAQNSTTIQNSPILGKEENLLVSGWKQHGCLEGAGLTRCADLAFLWLVGSCLL